MLLIKICQYFLSTGSYAGAVLGMPLSGILTKNFGWQSGFYVFGNYFFFYYCLFFIIIILIIMIHTCNNNYYHCLNNFFVWSYKTFEFYFPFWNTSRQWLLKNIKHHVKGLFICISIISIIANHLAVKPKIIKRNLSSVSKVHCMFSAHQKHVQLYENNKFYKIQNKL